MEHKLKTLVSLGFIQLVLLMVLQSMQKGSVSFMGSYGFPLGNRTVFVHPPRGAIVITDEEEIKRRTNSLERFAFIIAGDTTNIARPVVAVDFFEMGEFNDFAKLMKILVQDTTATILSKDIEGDYLTVRYRIPGNGDRPAIYSISRYAKCYPYYLRERAMWVNQETLPESVASAISAIEVKK